MISSAIYSRRNPARESLPSAMDLTADRALLDAFRRGSPKTLAEIYRHYEPSVTRLLRRGFTARGRTILLRLGPGAELEDLVQRIFTRAFDKDTRLSYDGLRPYGAFLNGIARNVVVDELRRRYRQSAPDLRLDEIESIPDPESGVAPEEQLEAEQARALVRKFLAEECDGNDRRLFELRYSEDHTQESAAEAAGLTRIQVRRWEGKLRARLLRFLKRERYV